MYIQYTYDETDSKHIVELYENYDDFMGLVKKELTFSNTKYTEVIKEVSRYISEESLDTLTGLFKAKLSGVVKPDGKYLNF